MLSSRHEVEDLGTKLWKPLVERDGLSVRG